LEVVLGIRRIGCFLLEVELLEIVWIWLKVCLCEGWLVVVFL